MGTIYVQTTGATTNSGSTDQNSANLSGSAATVAASVVTLDGSPDLSGLVTSGATQSSIYLENATNSNQKIFWITAFDNSAKTVTVSVAPTGTFTGTSNWAIGGRVVWTPANIEATLVAGDIVQFNDTPASRTSAFITFRASGDGTTGPITLRGKSGVRPVLTVTNTSNVIVGTSRSGWLIENLELAQQGASGDVIANLNQGCVVKDVKISDGGGIGINATVGGDRFYNCEITGTGGDGITTAGNASFDFFGCYIHDVGGDGIELTGASTWANISFTIVDTATGRGIYATGAAATITAQSNTVSNCTIYGCGDSGIEVVDAQTILNIRNSILQDNGNAAGEYNVEWAAGTAEVYSIHQYNVFYKTSNNLSGLTANSTESTADPQMIDPAGGNFGIKFGSPARAAGYPGAFLGGSTTGYLDIGAVQRREFSPRPTYAIGI